MQFPILKARAIVAAASVVVKDVSAGYVVGGNLAKYIKARSE